MFHRTITLHLLLAATTAFAQNAALDTSAIISGIEQRMSVVDKSPLLAQFIKVPEVEEAVPLPHEAPVPANAEARYELYANEDGSVAGITEFLRSPSPGVEQSASYYFDAEGSTVAVWWQMRWTGSTCSDSLAVETRYTYLHPANHVFYEYATLTDGKGADLDAPACTFPDIEQHFDTWYHRDVMLMMKHIPTQ